MLGTHNTTQHTSYPHKIQHPYSTQYDISLPVLFPIRLERFYSFLFSSRCNTHIRILSRHHPSQSPISAFCGPIVIILEYTSYSLISFALTNSLLLPLFDLDANSHSHACDSSLSYLMPSPSLTSPFSALTLPFLSPTAPFSSLTSPFPSSTSPFLSPLLLNRPSNAQRSVQRPLHAGRVQRAVPEGECEGHPVRHQFLHLYRSRWPHRRPQRYVPSYVLCTDYPLLLTADIPPSLSPYPPLCYRGIMFMTQSSALSVQMDRLTTPS